MPDCPDVDYQCILCDRITAIPIPFRAYELVFEIPEARTGFCDSCKNMTHFTRVTPEKIDA